MISATVATAPPWPWASACAPAAASAGTDAIATHTATWRALGERAPKSQVSGSRRRAGEQSAATTTTCTAISIGVRASGRSTPTCGSARSATSASSIRTTALVAPASDARTAPLRGRVRLAESSTVPGTVNTKATANRRDTRTAEVATATSNRPSRNNVGTARPTAAKVRRGRT